MKFVPSAFSYAFLLVLALFAAACLWEYQVVGQEITERAENKRFFLRCLCFLLFNLLDDKLLRQKMNE